MYGLTEESWIFTYASVFNLLRFIGLVEAYEEKGASQRYIIEKGRRKLISVSENCGYFPLILC